jgi:hypothetical protein
VAIAVFHMPVRLALTSAAYGAGYGVFPICWIILPVIFLYQLTVKTGHFETLQQSLANITDDSRLQLLLIAFALGALFEGTAGFGTPVAVCGAILISLGFRPVEAAGLALIADTAPVAFGGLGIPIVALHGVTGLDVLTLSKVIAVLFSGAVLADLGLCGISRHGRGLAGDSGGGADFFADAVPDGYLHGAGVGGYCGGDGDHRCADRVFALLEAKAGDQRQARSGERAGAGAV